jgi:hypothetical protein
MVERYPHTFTLIIPAQGIKDAQGNVINQPPILEKVVNGRAKTAGNSHNMILAENGDVLPYSHTISFPFFTEDFTKGIVRWNGRDFPIIRFRQYQNRCKVWI